jgi:threonine dehydrogenase-like Zn-dependent dehydrogenase
VTIWVQSYGRAVDIVSAGGVDAAKMLTHKFGLGGFAEALETVRRGDGLKVQIDPTA